MRPIRAINFAPVRPPAGGPKDMDGLDEAGTFLRRNNCLRVRLPAEGAYAGS